MKVYAVCTACSDDYYGYNAPIEIFETREKAIQWLDNNEDFEKREDGEYYKRGFLVDYKTEILEYEVK